jgi:hypothetical protein
MATKKSQKGIRNAAKTGFAGEHRETELDRGRQQIGA